MEFRIADTFTDSLARLTGDEQKAVKTTAFDLQMDPTGAGDTFAGGFMGYLASAPETTDEVLTRAAIAGSALASLAVEDFGLDGLLRASSKTIDQRFQAFKRLTHFEVL